MVRRWVGGVIISNEMGLDGAMGKKSSLYDMRIGDGTG